MTESRPRVLGQDFHWTADMPCKLRPFPQDRIG
jgi:hypothetical protein